MFKLIQNFLVAIILLITLFFLKIIGKKIASNLCAFMFSKIGPFSKFNKIAEKNILYVWPDKKNNDIKKITKGMWKNMGRNFGEIVHLRNYKPLHCNKTKIVGLNKIKNIVSLNNKRKKGIIFFSAHYGNWELGPLVIKDLKLEPLCLYRKSNNKFVEFIIQAIRSSNGKYAPKGDLGAKKSFLWLRKGKSLALLIDQKLNEGPSINFLGKPAHTASFIAELAIRMDLDIIPIQFSRDTKFENTIKFYNKIKLPKKNLRKEERINITLRQINDTVSEWIKNKPEYWLWIHRRWSKKLYL